MPRSSFVSFGNNKDSNGGFSEVETGQIRNRVSPYPTEEEAASTNEHLAKSHTNESDGRALRRRGSARLRVSGTGQVQRPEQLNAEMETTNPTTYRTATKER